MGSSSNWFTLEGWMLRAFLFRYSLGSEVIKVVGPPNEWGWAKVLLRIKVDTGEVTPGEDGPGRDELWMPGFPALLESGHVVELS